MSVDFVKAATFEKFKRFKLYAVHTPTNALFFDWLKVLNLH